MLAIQHHHDPLPPAEAIPKVAWVAERVAAVFEGGDHAQNRNIALEALGGLGLRGDAAEAVLEGLPVALSEAAAVFQRSLGKQPDLGTLLREANSSLVDLNSSYQDLVRTLEALVIEKEALAGSLREANERLAHLAATDSLTGLLNRRAFHDAFHRDLARAERSGAPLALLMIDVDHFKTLNDTHGHKVGDDVLKAVATALAATVREGDVVGRYGGEEFVVLLPGALPPDSITVAERLRGAIARVQFDGMAGSFGVTASFGAVSSSGAKMSADEMIRRADEAMYAAKRAGRNRVLLAESA